MPETKKSALTEVRCKQCDKKLGLFQGEAEIKCPRCKKVNHVRVSENTVTIYVK